MKTDCYNTQILTTSKHHHHVVTETLKSLGFYNNYDEDYRNYPWIVITNSGSFGRNSDENMNYKRVTLEEFLQLYYKEASKNPVEVILNDEYTAKVYSNKIVVGCQTFDTDIVEKLAEALQKAIKDKIVESKRYATFTYTKPGYYGSDAETTHRKIVVIEEDDRVIEGNDTDDNMKFKRFLKSRMSNLQYTTEE